MDHAWGLADQAVVSGTSFLTLFFIARWSGAEQAGLYAIGVSAIVLLTAAMESLVTRPYSLQIYKTPYDRREHAMGAFLLTLALALATMAVASALWVVLEMSGRMETGAQIVGVLAIAMPAILLREFVRRFAFANLMLRDALVVDGAVAILVLSCLVWLGFGGLLSAKTAFVASSVAALLVVAIWLAYRRRIFSYSGPAVRQTARQSWQLGRWLLPNRVALEAHGYVTHWIAFILGGAAATGIYAACLLVLALANPFLGGVFNIMTPKAVRALETGGPAALKSLAYRYAVTIGGAMSIFAVFVGIFGDAVMAFMFPQGEHGGYGTLLTILAVSFVVAPIGLVANVALISIERSRTVTAISLATLACGTIFIALGMLGHGLVGAAIGMVCTETLNAALLWGVLVAMLRETRAGGSSAEAAAQL